MYIHIYIFIYIYMVLCCVCRLNPGSGALPQCAATLQSPLMPPGHGGRRGRDAGTRGRGDGRCGWKMLGMWIWKDLWDLKDGVWMILMVSMGSNQFRLYSDLSPKFLSSAWHLKIVCTLCPRIIINPPGNSKRKTHPSHPVTKWWPLSPGWPRLTQVDPGSFSSPFI